MTDDPNWRTQMLLQPVGGRLPWTGWPEAVQNSMTRTWTLIKALSFLTPEAVRAAKVDLNNWRAEDFRHFRSVAHFEPYSDTDSEVDLMELATDSDASD